MASTPSAPSSGSPTTSQLYIARARSVATARLADGGPLAVDTGHVHRPLAEGQVRRRRARLARTASGGATSTSRSPEDAFDGLRAKVVEHLEAQATLYVVDAFAGADPAHRIGVRVVTASPYHALFAKTMFIDPTADGARVSSTTDALVLHAPAVEADPEDGRHAHRHVRRAPPVADRGADRRHVLRGRDQEVDLHGDERPAAARGRLPDALLGERRRRRRGRGLLRPLGHRQDDALRRPGAAPDRRRRARLGRRTASSTSRAAATRR